MMALVAWLGLPTAMLCACFFAWRVGAAAERIGSLAIFVANVAGGVVLAMTYPHFPTLILGALDFLLACGLLAIAIRYANYWVGFAMLLQSGSLCLQGLDLAGEGPSMLTHIIANNVISDGMLACITAGVLGAWMAKRRRAAASMQAEPTPPGAMLTF